MPRFRTILAACLALTLFAACGHPAEEPPDSSGAVDAELSALVGDIREGLADLPGLAEAEPAAARQRVVELYITRQEEIERLWGPNGARGPTPGLARAVAESERRFHALMELLAGDPPPDSAATAEAAAALDRGLEEVLRAAAGAGGQGEGGQSDGVELDARLDAIAAGLDTVAAEAAAGRTDAARRVATRLYLDEYEPIEGWYGPGAPYGEPPLAARVAAAEAAFHALLAADDAEIPLRADATRASIVAIRPAAAAAGVPRAPGEAPVPRPAAGLARTARTPEFQRILAELDAAEAAYRAGDREAALRGVEHAYLEGLEPLEARLPSAAVGRAERLFHLALRPRIARGSAADEVAATFAALEAELLELDVALAGGPSFWFGAASSFLIVFREGLEAVLLIGAILAYLGRVSGEKRHRRQVWSGAALGVAASFATWGVARTVVPVGGGSRELIEGVTALLAVGVLLYVSHWLFQKTYLHDWKAYLQNRVGTAVTTGSAVAMAGLAFAVVYREGFETVLFYQALLTDAGAGSVLAGFVPGLLLVVAVGAGIIRAGLRLPLSKVFGATNAILLYLAFVFLGKGLYNLQEAGVFAPRPLAWAPDHPALRQLLGLYPVAETLVAQAAFLVLLGVTWALYRRRRAVARTELARAKEAEAAARA